jgi:hypothetical protein
MSDQQDAPAETYIEQPDFVTLFSGIVSAPQTTFAKINSSFSLSSAKKLWLSSLAMIFLASALPAVLKASSPEGTIRAIGFFLSNLTAWSVLSLTLYYLSFTQGARRLTAKNAFCTVAWAFLPFIFFAPVACFKGILGGGFMLLACLPTLWFLALLWLGFKTALQINTVRMALMLIVVPPILCTIYFFWIGLAVFSLISQVLAKLS